VFSSTNQSGWRDGRNTGKQRPVSVTIGEYPSGVERRIPTRFDFLPAPAADVRKSASSGDGSNVTCQLQSELAQTLSRSNLRKQTDLQVKLLCEDRYKPLSLSSWECCLYNTLRYIYIYIYIQCATDLEHLYRIYSIPTHDKHHWHLWTGGVYNW